MKRLCNVLFCSLFIIHFFACKNKKVEDPCIVKKRISTVFTLNDYDSVKSKFKDTRAFKTYTKAKSLELFDISISKHDYYRIWYESPDPVYNWIVDIDPVNLKFMFFSFFIDNKKMGDSVEYKFYRYDEILISKSLFKEICDVFYNYNILNIEDDLGISIKGEGNIFNIERMYKGIYKSTFLYMPDIEGSKESQAFLNVISFLIKKLDLPLLGENPCKIDRSDSKRKSYR